MNECPLCLLESLSKTDNLMWWFKISTLHSCSQHWDLFFCLQPNTLTSMSFYCSLFLGLIRITSPIFSPGLAFNLHCVLDKHTLLSIHFSDHPVFKLLHLQTKSLRPVNLSAVGANFLYHPDEKYCIFQLELYQFLCFVSLFFHYIFSYLQ